MEATVTLSITEYNKLIANKLQKEVKVVHRPPKSNNEQRLVMEEEVNRLSVARVKFYEEVNAHVLVVNAERDLIYLQEEQAMWRKEREDMQEYIVDLQSRSILRMIYNKYLGG